ncbi:hypothetical protein PVAP13_5NG448740 [Panicum virgatum]|uniref:Uncharacterized protein n=1 Tax=Panicum virgatum TaxID=38727 RepID=A0A8T0S033_PANVG|nr:hypothetical protein PVAP13_5NG448740 [Panicum virgatum]
MYTHLYVPALPFVVPPLFAEMIPLAPHHHRTSAITLPSIPIHFPDTRDHAPLRSLLQAAPTRLLPSPLRRRSGRCSQAEPRLATSVAGPRAGAREALRRASIAGPCQPAHPCFPRRRATPTCRSAAPTSHAGPRAPASPAAAPPPPAARNCSAPICSVVTSSWRRPGWSPTWPTPTAGGSGPAAAQRVQRHRRRLQREPARHLHHRRAQLILRHTIGLLDFSQELRGFQTVTCHQVRPVFLGILTGFRVSVSSGWFACSWIQAVVTNLDNAHIRSGTQACPGH